VVKRGSDPDEIAGAIAEAGRVLLETSLEVLERSAPDLSLSHLQVLTLLDQLGPRRLMDIANALDVTPTTATRLADRLTQSGMVDRVRQSDDRREIHLALSDQGARLVAAVAASRRRLITSRLRNMSTVDERAALELLRRLSQSRLSAEAEPA